MKAAAKIAISLPAKTLREVEITRKKLGQSRSALIARAIEHWLHANAMSKEDELYVQGYLRHPERTEETAVVASEIIKQWTPWE